jgi:hypothetical protein
MRELRGELQGDQEKNGIRVSAQREINRNIDTKNMEAPLV